MKVLLKFFVGWTTGPMLPACSLKQRDDLTRVEKRDFTGPVNRPKQGFDSTDHGD